MIYLTWPLPMGIVVVSDCPLLKTNLHAHFGAFILPSLGKQSWEATMCWCQILKTHLSHLNLTTSLPDETDEDAETERSDPVPLLTQLVAGPRRSLWGLVELLAPSLAASLDPSSCVGPAHRLWAWPYHSL